MSKNVLFMTFLFGGKGKRKKFQKIKFAVFRRIRRKNGFNRMIFSMLIFIYILTTEATAPAEDSAHFLLILEHK